MINVHFPQPGGYYDWKDWASALVMALKDMQPQTQNTDEAQAETNTDLQQQILDVLVDFTELANSALHGECELVFVNSTNIRLSRRKLGYLIINDVLQQVPDVGVTLTLGLLAVGKWYIYAWMNGANMALEPSATAPVKQANGVYTKGADTTRTLVGMVHVQVANTFNEALVRSWFFDRGVIATLGAVASSTTATTSTRIAALDTVFLAWAGEPVFVVIVGRGDHSAASYLVTVQCGMDSVAFGPTSIHEAQVARTIGPFALDVPFIGITEGIHTANLFASGSVAGTFTISHIQLSVYTPGVRR